MKFTHKHIKPYFDNFNICNLIKKINKNYRLCFDTKNKNFLVLDISNNYQICLKTNRVDSRILFKLQQTSTSNSEHIFKEIEIHNEKLKQKILQDTKEKAIDSAVEISRYSKRTNLLTNREINKIKEGKYA